ncbi:MAG: fused response regulator/phosphatase [Clostridia bacterium]|nr:fused response regulator/phosphatase [Clostridia bacterium]
MHKVLIADDVGMNRMLIRSILKSKLSNIEYFEAENGDKVIEIVKAENIDLIILDLIMPVKDGFETLQYLKNSALYHHIPVIVNSALSEITSIEKTLEMGAIEYFTKPFSPDDIEIILPLKVKNALRLHDQNKEIERLNIELNQELKNANEFAKYMLPKNATLNKVDFEILYHPSLGIGGDFIDCIEIGNKVWFMVADITGHGIAAGMASSMIKILFRLTVELPDMTPKKLLETINERIFKIFGEDNHTNYIVFTSFVGCIENNELTYSNAAQPYPIIYCKEKDCVMPIENGGMLVGMLENISYDEYKMPLNPGDGIFVYTDGLFSTGKGSDYTHWTLVNESCGELKSIMAEDTSKFLENIFWKFDFLHKSNGSDFTDDVALIYLKLKS